MNIFLACFLGFHEQNQGVCVGFDGVMLFAFSGKMLVYVSLVCVYHLFRRSLPQQIVMLPLKWVSLVAGSNDR